MPYHADLSGKRIASTMLAAIMIASPLCQVAFPSVASAQVTPSLKDLNASIAEVEATIEEQEKIVAKSQVVLSGAVRDAYKSGDLASGSEMELILNADTLDDLISNSQYVEAMNGKYASAIGEARDALAELEEAKASLVDLRAEKEAAIKSIERADAMNFQQWGQYYSDIRYYASTIGSAGCGLCAFTVAMNILLGTDYTPETILPERGDWQGMDHYPDDRTGTPDGSTHAEWAKTAFGVDMERIDNSLPAIRKALVDEGGVVVVLARGQSFKDKNSGWRYTNGHYVCIYRCDDGGFYVQDSAGTTPEDGRAVYYADDEMGTMLSTGTFIKYTQA